MVLTVIKSLTNILPQITRIESDAPWHSSGHTSIDLRKYELLPKDALSFQSTQIISEILRNLHCPVGSLP